MTPTVVFVGDKLVLNINTSAAGNARVAILDAKGTPIRGFSIADCDEIMTNDVAHAVTWKGKTDVSGLAGRPIRLRFEMRAAKLYAFQFRRQRADHGVDGGNVGGRPAQRPGGPVKSAPDSS